MLSIGEFSKICRVSPKTIRHYEKIGLLLPDKVNPENGYRYYAIEKLETMLFISRLKNYHFSLEEIKEVLHAQETRDEMLFGKLTAKRREIEQQMRETQSTLEQLAGDISNLKRGKTVMSYIEDIDVRLVEVQPMRLLSIRRMVTKEAFAGAYADCYGRIFKSIAAQKLTQLAPPMVLFHSGEFSPFGLDTEFAVPVKECVTGTREFTPGLCLKTVLQGSYVNLPSVYVKQRRWAEQEGYVESGALYEVYVTDPSEAADETELITEVYSPVKI